MAITNDEQLANAVITAGALLQEIQEYVGRDFTKPAKVRFPRGYLRTAAQARDRLGFVDDRNLRSNIAYTMMLSDVQHWLLARTDLSGTAKEMIIKLQLFLLGSIVESITKVLLRGRCGGSYSKRIDHMREHSIISSELATDLNWLWGIRNKMHLFQLDETEWLSTDYTVANHNRAVRAFKQLLDILDSNQDR
ncbi:MAG: hypothetical protein O9318_08815 [Hylemonella sp.]|uniref:hypothetical protein n=1 Tax=Hylemonella sp. TaxID=2066020 RepID=UPI0022BB91A0|nr:hypothetical protein [Hylemonella sp.]MCZ8252556.1 hypothetical protein [Hylemonella sp.]